MKAMIATLAACVTILVPNVVHATPPMAWGFQNLPDAMDAAKSSGKPLFVLFGFETCGGCKTLYRQALSDENLRRNFQKNFILAYVDTEGHGEPPGYEFGDDVMSHAELVTKLKGYPTPSWVFLTPAGVRLHGNRGGKTPPGELMRDGDVALEKFKAGTCG